VDVLYLQVLQSCRGEEFRLPFLVFLLILSLTRQVFLLIL
jgi:hypothetical protein